MAKGKDWNGLIAAGIGVALAAVLVFIVGPALGWW
jgi:hypothetical protein